MALLKLAFASALGYGLYRYWKKSPQGVSRAAFATGESTPGAVDVRNAGQEAMASDIKDWDELDQASDESFPASDPPSSNRFT
ncbi:hypothetical protein [Sphingobium fluviale]|uniref:Uncharacterized protein n=1 Tax=Sphingobium fluviale TaxID=2506423 RepID=A0A4Q1KM31_9SPHN|nr:hypothetical protein [Sphingobium fluviale]RXR29844.1 hypothetical protein EQG66_04685 [Sphingobium fluviale]